jgi:ubiquinone/menaquinone biosynthesis C-methylase UbiE
LPDKAAFNSNYFNKSHILVKGMSMTLHPFAPTSVLVDSRAKEAADAYVEASLALDDRSYWGVRMFCATNLFLWHLKAFSRDEDPVPLFEKAYRDAAALLTQVKGSGVSGNHFSADATEAVPDTFENKISGLFSDIWVNMTDDVYFDESFEFTKQRFERNGIDPFEFFEDKIVVDGGCGSGKFSAALARFGAKKVIGIDIGENGLEFARAQAKKVDYGDRLHFRYGSLLDLPLEDASIDIVWTNGVVHHTLDYQKCVAEFNRVLKPGGDLFFYVNGRFGLYELMWDTLRMGNEGIPRALFQNFLVSLGINSGRVYWMMDCFFAPYEWKERKEVESILEKHNFTDLKQLVRGVDIDMIEQVSAGLPYADVKYGEAQLKYLAKKAS